MSSALQPAALPQASAGVRIRFAGLADVDAIVALGRENYDDSRNSPHPFDEEKARRHCLRAISEPGRQAMLVSERDGKPVGFLWGNVSESLFSSVLLGVVVVIYVTPRARNGYSAIKLIHAFRNWARAKGAVELHVNVTGGVLLARTDRFLRRIGFMQTGGNYVAALATPDTTAPGTIR